jgi:DNA-binding HxlR family transcriptional regulator/putative sterol carrier protein
VTTRRRYDDGCAAAHALDLVGERWALLVVRELLLGPKRFTDLRAGLPGISPNVLSQRLDGLERVAVVRRRKLPPPAGSWVYELTEWGRGLEPIIVQLGRWGACSPFMDRGCGLSVDSLVLSLRTLFNPDAVGGLTATYELRFGDDRFEARVADDQFHIARGEATRPDAVIEGDPATLAGVVYDGRDLTEAMRTGALKVSGDLSAVERFLTLFSLPEPAAL